MQGFPPVLSNQCLYTFTSLCEYLVVKHHTILCWVEQRGMPASKVGKLWRFKTVDKWVRTAEPPMSGR
ncbi:MAG: excisionase family DNA-binding protein [Dethiobacteria bacterium]